MHLTTKAETSLVAQMAKGGNLAGGYGRAGALGAGGVGWRGVGR